MSVTDIALYCPPMQGRFTGGFLYNRHLLAQLVSNQLSVELIAEVETTSDASIHLVDSLYAVEYLRIKPSFQQALFLYHLPPYTDTKVPESWLEIEKSLLLASRIVVTGSFAMDILVKRHGPFAGSKVSIISPGICNEWPQKNNFAPLPKQLLVVAAITPGKGISRVLDTLAACADLPWHCTFYGEVGQEPEYAQQMLEKAHALGLEHKTTFAGCIEQELVGKAMQQADLLLHFSEFETYSMVTAEAIACGLPVLSFPVGEVQVFQTATNVQYVATEPEELAGETLRKLLTDKACYKALCQWESSPRKTWGCVAAQWVELLAQQAEFAAVYQEGAL